ncbi:hypothetical protein T05_8928 [Trichinella murrelli]|uniref:Uncharacterized protein n=1 Tax=Trichinella murrelli TaxID=144512 RepID=A0A0V0TUM7_9BILA|nr:hypothetical protein T05_8928 [Trichinella murrelli]
MPIRTSIISGVSRRCPISGLVPAGAPSERWPGTGWTLPQTRGIASACTRVLASVWHELSTAPSRNSTLIHLRSGPTRPPRVVKRQRSWDSVSPRTSATSFRMKETFAPCRRGSLPPRGFHPVRRLGRGRSGLGPTRGASSGQKALVGFVGLRWRGGFLVVGGCRSWWCGLRHRSTPHGGPVRHSLVRWSVFRHL